MNRRNFIKTIPVISAGVMAVSIEKREVLLSDSDLKSMPLKYPYYINCYIQNQQYWPLEEYKEGCFDPKESSNDGITACGEKFIDGKLRFFSFYNAVTYIEMHSQVVDFKTEIAYEVFRDEEEWAALNIPPKHIYNYWVKINPFKYTSWIHPDYIDNTDQTLIEYI